MDVNEVPTVSVDILLLVTQKLTRQIAAVFRLYMSCMPLYLGLYRVVQQIINLQTVAIPSTLKIDEGDPWPNEHRRSFLNCLDTADILHHFIVMTYKQFVLRVRKNSE